MQGVVAQRWLEFLERHGYAPRVEVRDEHQVLVRCSRRGRGFVVFVEEGDPTFLHLAAAYHVALDAPDPRALLAAANEVNNYAKGVKAVVAAGEHGVHFHVESFTPEPWSQPQLLDRAGVQLHGAARVFFERLGAPCEHDPVS